MWKLITYVLLANPAATPFESSTEMWQPSQQVCEARREIFVRDTTAQLLRHNRPGSFIVQANCIRKEPE